MARNNIGQSLVRSRPWRPAQRRPWSGLGRRRGKGWTWRRAPRGGGWGVGAAATSGATQDHIWCRTAPLETSERKLKKLEDSGGKSIEKVFADNWFSVSKYVFGKSYSLTENYFSGKTFFYTLASRCQIEPMRVLWTGFAWGGLVTDSK